MLLPLLDPAHGAPDQAGQEGDQQVLGVDVSLGAEAAADIERHAADARLGQLQEPGGRPAHRVHHLRCRPDRDGVGALVVGGDHAAALDGNAGIAMGVEATAKPVGSGGKSRPPPRLSRWRARRSGWSRTLRGGSPSPTPARPRHRRRPPAARCRRRPARRHRGPGSGSRPRPRRPPRRHGGPCPRPASAVADCGWRAARGSATWPAATAGRRRPGAPGAAAPRR